MLNTRHIVYGRRLGEPTRNDIPLNGIAVDHLFAVNENAVRVLEFEEATGLQAKAAEASARISSQPATVINMKRRPWRWPARLFSCAGPITLKS